MRFLKKRMHRVLTIFGTRPEAIKLAPVIRELQKRPEHFESIVGLTGQHDELLQQMIELFRIEPDFNLKVMKNDQTLAGLTAAILGALSGVLEQTQPDIVLVQGDTTTVLTAALASYYGRIKIGHVEAGLRTGDKYQPFPEEMNRLLTDQLSDFCFAPTEINRANLLHMGIPAEKIFLTGNTIIDALQTIRDHLSLQGSSDELIPGFDKMILITVHRRENFGRPLQEIFEAVRHLACRHPEIGFIYPVHPNPHVREPAYAILQGQPNIKLMPPLNYLEMVSWMQKSYLILTDSGGVQEEAPALHKPVLVLRDKTERPEVVAAGGAKLVGSHQDRIINAVEHLLENKEAYGRMCAGANPYGDGLAAQKIVDILEQVL